MHSPELQKGIVIADRYTLKEYKGSGSFGEVWLAHDNELGMDVAIKLYISLDKKGQDEFKDEYKIAFGLNHENLLTAQYYSVWNHRPYLIMKYCSKGSSANMGGDVTEDEIWRFIHDVSNGLKYLHGQEPPIIHQDIKPENILVDENDNFLITDFGISRKMRTTMRKQSKRAIESGALAYMGPERFLADPMAVKASDIWSLGVSIYEMATDDLPFLGQGGGMMNAGAQIPQLGEKWSDNLNDVMQACLAKETWDRPTAEELSEYTNQRLKNKNLSWKQWTTGEGSIDDGEKNTSKKWYGLWTSVIAVIAIVCCTIIYRGSRNAIPIMHYENLVNNCKNNIYSGSSVNYRTLIVAKYQLDSINTIANEYGFEHPDLESILNDKLTEASAAWVKHAEGQLNVAEDIPAAINSYHIAALLDNNSTIDEALSHIASKYNCDGAFIVVRRAMVNDDNLKIYYNGTNSQTIYNVPITYKLTDHHNTTRIEGQTTVTIHPGVNQTIEIILNQDATGYDHVELSENNIVFYNTEARE